jgi:SAM-dependent methyltransferase
MTVDDYDRVPYPSSAYRETRPDHLELVGRLFHLGPRPAHEARVLEIGCASGGNLFPTAERFPGARLVGIDRSAEQIAAGRRDLAILGLTNVELICCDLAELDEGFGAFDYIVAHGVYSWVAPPVRESLLAAIAGRLAPRGIALVSYDAKPGWHLKALGREILREGAGAGDPDGQVRAARTHLDFIAAGARPDDARYRALLADQVHARADVPDNVLYHDDLAEFCQGFWFWEVAERLAAHGLAYLADANLATMAPDLEPATLQAVGALAGSLIEGEQLLDFLNNRRFRTTLVCHAGAAIKRSISAAALVDLHVASDVALEALADPDRPPSVESLSELVLLLLAEEWPGSLPFRALVERVRAASEVPVAAERVAAELAGVVLELVFRGDAELALHAPAFVLEPSAQPCASKVARLDATRGPRVTSLRHMPALLSDEERRMIALCDGSRDREALARELGMGLETVEAVLGGLARQAVLVL